MVPELTFTDAVGSIGVFLLLLAFFLNVIGSLGAGSIVYICLNLVGAGLACYSAWLLGFMPFVVLEGTWALVAALALGRALLRKAVARDPTKLGP